MTSLGETEYSQGVGEEKNMSLAIEKILVPAICSVAPLRAREADATLNISVVFTSIEATLAALKEAGDLANSLGARITLVVPQVVPYPLPLETPPVLIDFSENRFRVLASESPVETNVQIYLCRDRFETLVSTLKPGSIVVLGGRRRWWPTKDEVLARQLRRAGHEVVFKETE
jgi:hypothetical protein